MEATAAAVVAAYPKLWDTVLQKLSALLSLPATASPQHPDLVAAENVLAVLSFSAVASPAGMLSTQYVVRSTQYVVR
jgi:hypothetical protein